MSFVVVPLHPKILYTPSLALGAIPVILLAGSSPAIIPAACVP
jgi:hypothetical protein